MYKIFIVNCLQYMLATELKLMQQLVSVNEGTQKHGSGGSLKTSAQQGIAINQAAMGTATQWRDKRATLVTGLQDLFLQRPGLLTANETLIRLLRYKLYYIHYL